MKNEHGLDIDYCRKKLAPMIVDIKQFTPNELARALVQLAVTVDSDAASNELHRLRK